MDNLTGWTGYKPEQLVVRRDAASGLVAVIAVDSMVLGPAAGGCRRWTYVDESAAVLDAVRLAQSMTFKNALADIPFGGGKSVIISDGRKATSAQQLKTFADWLNDLQGRYVTAEDVGMGVAEMQALSRHTHHVSGLGINGVGGDPSPKTAYGVFLGLKRLVQSRLGHEHLYGLRVAVQGLGAVGMSLCHWLARAGADLVVADMNAQRVQMAVRKYDAVAVGPEAILDVRSDAFAPCALGGVITPEVAAKIDTHIIAGAANNQLSETLAADVLASRGITYAPDFVLNAGGVISVAYEYLKNCEDDFAAVDESWVNARIEGIPQRIEAIVSQALENGGNTDHVARQLATDLVTSRKFQDLSSAQAESSTLYAA